MSILFAATYPERTSALILYGTYAKRLRTDDYPWAPTRDEWEHIIAETERQWGGPVGWESRAPSAAGDERLRKWWSTYLRLGASPGAVNSIWRMAMELQRDRRLWRPVGGAGACVRRRAPRVGQPALPAVTWIGA